MVAKVDAEANKGVASTHGIKSYPTIKFFPKGTSTPEDYAGARDESGFVEYLNGKAGTHRAPGGGLDASAGTVAALDSLVHKFTGSNLEDITGQVGKAVDGLKDVGSEYYVKVLGKLKTNDAWLEKETTRLQGMLNKGGLARSKEDDLTRRLNVLKRFAKGEADADEVKAEL